MIRKRRRCTRRVNRDRLFLMADAVIRDLRFDLIGWDSCVLATRLMHERLKRIGVDSIPLACWARAEYQNHTVRLCHQDGSIGHAVLGVFDLVLDLTINQVHELNPAMPPIEAVAMNIPAEAPPDFTAGLRMGDLRLTYGIQRSKPVYYLNSLDWTQPIERIDRMVDALRGLTKQQYDERLREYRQAKHDAGRA